MFVQLTLFLSCLFFQIDDSLYVDSYSIEKGKIILSFFNGRNHDHYSQPYLISKDKAGDYFIFDGARYYLNRTATLEQEELDRIAEYFKGKANQICYNQTTPRLILTFLVDEEGNVMLGGGYLDNGCERNFLEVHNYIDLKKIRFSPGKIKSQNVRSIFTVVLPFNN
ncbi:MAG: hypothetical protein J7604_00585 [Sporocytophaga sp.]|uniref:hypothetical protein n=1 Tax=Sporocytophaga sp. TaxID=2231183 RepID=UPI001B0CDB77|nr:hypothetical protein [Sporocytophaga sp.]MBO9698666.1 hypothetical protein [Sporocytophaga sp.]